MKPPMKGKKIGYWIATGLVALAMLPGGVLDAIQKPEALEILHHLGYPSYFASIIGVWKILATIAILAPGFPVVKEWAYAGIVFDLSGAVVSHAAVGDGPKGFLLPLLLIGITVAS